MRLAKTVKARAATAIERAVGRREGGHHHAPGNRCVARAWWFRSPGVLATAAVAVSLAARDAHADSCPAPEEAPAVASVASEERLDYLARAFDREVHDIDAWSWTWGSVYSSGTIALGVALSETRDRGIRTDLTVGVISAAVGAVSLYGLPLKLTLPLRASRRSWDDPDRCAVLARAERTLVSVERDQRLANGILAHVGNLVANAGIALVLGLGYGRWTSAAISAGVGVGVGETNAFTQPHHLREVLARYRSGQLGAVHAGVAWSVAGVFTREMTGVAFTASW
jgi:hypothetical protein